MKIDTDDLSYLFNDANSLVSSHDADELYELLIDEDVNDKIQAAICLYKTTPEYIEALHQIMWGAYESKIGRA